MKRREFLIKTASGSLVLTLPLSTLQGCMGDEPKKASFGLCADVHKDIMHDADKRLNTFIEAARAANTDFILQLGDFCRPYAYNDSFMKIWNSYEGNGYHVIGNHDMDGGFSRESVLDYWGLVAKYYSFDMNGIHFIVLDGNDVNLSGNKAPGYARFIGEKQMNWLKKDLRFTDKPVVIFSHQSLENIEGIENATEVQKVLEDENSKAGFSKVIACFSGHHHTDYCVQINGIYYIQINSMSYSWLGDKYKTIRYSEEIDKQFPWIKYTVPYGDPLYAIVEISKNELKITGKQSYFVEPTPEDLGVPKNNNRPIVPQITTRELNFSEKNQQIRSDLTSN